MTSPTKPIAILILAAGGSSRMGKPKQLLPIGEETLLSHTIKTAKSVANTRVCVVLGSNAQAIKSSIDARGLHIIVNPNWQEGIGSSIAAGLTVISVDDYSGVLILLADQPMVCPNHLDKIIQKFSQRPDQIVATAYLNTRGVPALFGKQHFENLLNLKGDQGAQMLLRKSDPIVITPPKFFDDIDTPEAYQTFLKG